MAIPPQACHPLHKTTACRWCLVWQLCLTGVLFAATLLHTPAQAVAYRSLSDPDRQLTASQRAAVWQKLLPLNRGQMKFRVLVLRSLEVEATGDRLAELARDIPARRYAVLLLVMEQKIFRVLVSEEALSGASSASLDSIMAQSLPYLRAGAYDTALVSTLDALAERFAD